MYMYPFKCKCSAGPQRKQKFSQRVKVHTSRSSLHFWINTSLFFDVCIECQDLLPCQNSKCVDISFRLSCSVKPQIHISNMETSTVFFCQQRQPNKVSLNGDSNSMRCSNFQMDCICTTHQLDAKLTTANLCEERDGIAR